MRNVYVAHIFRYVLFVCTLIGIVVKGLSLALASKKTIASEILFMFIVQGNGITLHLFR